MYQTEIARARQRRAELVNLLRHAIDREAQGRGRGQERRRAPLDDIQPSRPVRRSWSVPDQQIGQFARTAHAPGMHRAQRFGIRDQLSLHPLTPARH
jgi:hypothetical protein